MNKNNVIYYDTIGFSKTNIYVVKIDNENILIDCGGRENSHFIQHIIQKYYIKYVIITHAHLDHCGGIERIKDKVKIFVPDKDIRFIENNNLIVPDNIWGKTIKLINLFYKFQPFFKPVPVSQFPLKEFINFIPAPGHTPGSGCFYDKDHRNLFTGDVLYTTSEGKIDLITTKWSQDINLARISLKNLKNIDVENIYPGHGNPILNIKQDYYNKILKI